ncbi:MAG TPA: ATP-binding protein, partial [Vicinamibacterales bacterium]|nr:ATP-binding protein [Vicinamibacterales bacterium]
MSVRPQAVARRSSEEHSGTLLQRGAAIGLVLYAGFVVTPASWIVLRELVIYALAEVVAITSVLVGVYRYRPSAPQAWLLIGGGLVLFLIADVIWGVYKTLGRDPFPSVADVFYLGAYPFFAAGLVVATIRRRGYGVDVRATIDAAIVTVICGYYAWVGIVMPVVNDDMLTPYERIVTILYPAADMLLLAVAARFLIGSSWNMRALRIFVAGLFLLFMGDVIFARNSAGLQYETLWDSMLLAGILMMGVAALDPSMRALTEEPGDPWARSDKVRRVLIACAVMVPPLVLAWQQLQGQPLYLSAHLTAIVALTLLVAARFGLMAAGAEKSAAREATLSDYTANLLAAVGRDRLFAIARQALTMLGKTANGKARLVLEGEHDTRRQMPFRTEVKLRGKEVGTISVDADPATLRLWRESLTTIATQLSIALERDWLLATEQETAERLTQQNARLRELDAMKDRFVSAVTHELRTPLTSMMGYLEILSAGEVGELNGDQARMVNIIDRNCRRLDELIGEILVTAQIDSGRLKYKFTQVDIARLASKQVESIQAVADKNDIRLELIVESQPPLLSADEMRLGQVIDNLLSNAIKFTPAGGTITVRVAHRGDTASLEVRDTGVGIPADELDQIFGRFYRTTTATATPGTGLGLWIAQSIAKDHGGTISVTS